MKDGIIKKTGNSRYIMSVADFLEKYPTYEDFAEAIASGTLTIDWNGLNPDGWYQIGTHLDTENILSDETAFYIGLDATAVPDDAFRHIYGLIAKAKELIASAVTDMGVYTDPESTFPEIADNIHSIDTMPKDVHRIILSANPNMYGTVSGGGYASNGMTITVHANPDTQGGYEFDGWHENGYTVSNEKDYTFKVTGDRTLEAEFSEITIKYTITVQVDPSGGGTATGGGTFKSGQTVTLVAMVNSGYSFTGWYNASSGAQLSTSTTYTFTASQNITVTAKFATIPTYSISASISPSGSGSVSGTGNYQQGRSATLVATANTDYIFNNWTESGSQVSANASYTFTVTKSRSLTANFSKSPYVIGKDWVSVSMPNKRSLASVTYGGGKFVAVGGVSSTYGDAAAVYSTDGVIWNEATLPGGAHESWTGVAYGNGKFVAAGYRYNDHHLAYSSDGKTWYDGSIPDVRDILCITYGNGKFVALCTTTSGSSVAGYSAYYSTNGINWTAAKIPQNEYDSITYGNGKFVAVGDTYDFIYSTDGINWSTTSLSERHGWGSVTYGDGKFVAVSGYGSTLGDTYVAYSLNGVAWTVQKMTSSSSWNGVTYGSGKFVAVGLTTGGVGAVAYSSDGISWQTNTTPVSEWWKSVAYGNGKFVAVTSTSQNKIIYSSSTGT